MSVVSSIKPPSRPASSAAGFQRVRHVAPKFRANGKEIDGPATCSQNILSENIKMPQQWEAPQNDQTRSRMTQKKLEMQRKKADMPHHSFDIDGDGQKWCVIGGWGPRQESCCNRWCWGCWSRCGSSCSVTKNLYCASKSNYELEWCNEYHSDTHYVTVY